MYIHGVSVTPENTCFKEKHRIKKLRVSVKMRSLLVVIIAALSLAPTWTSFAAAPRITDNRPPEAPDGLAAVNRTHTSIVLSWRESSDNIKVRGYYIFRDGKKIVTTSKTIYTNTDLIPGREYTYAIKAYDAAGNVSDSSSTLIVSTLPDLAPPSAPYQLSAVSTDYTSICLSWKPSKDDSGLKGYVIYCNGEKKASTSGTSYICKGFLPGKSYSFFVKSYDRAGNYSGTSNVIMVSTMKDTSAPSSPTELKAAAVTEVEANLTWSPSLDNVKVSNYEIFLDGARKGSTSKTSYKIANLAPGKTYAITVRALDASGNRSAASSRLEVTTRSDNKAPDAPSGLVINSINGAKVSLSWNPSKDNVKVKGYRIYCNGLVVADTTRTTRSVRNPTGLPLGMYWVKAYDLVDNISPSSNVVTVLHN